MHKTVLPREAIDALHITPGSIIVDVTANGGGHSDAILHHVGGEGLLVSIDVDPGAVAVLRTRFAQEIEQGRARVVCGNFRTIDTLLVNEGINEVHGILADLGWSSNQFEPSEGSEKRGFSFMHDEPLLMTYGDPARYAFTARDIVNTWKESDIANVLYGYGEERHSRKIAKAIIDSRANTLIETSGQLADIITSVMPRRGKIHPATKTFQALRIAVNDELDALSEFIEKGFRMLSPGGRLAIITFHSIEDRIVKHTFKDLVKQGHAHNPIKKHIVAGRDEVAENPRARSAKLRIIERIS